MLRPVFPHDTSSYVVTCRDLSPILCYLLTRYHTSPVVTRCSGKAKQRRTFMTCHDNSMIFPQKNKCSYVHTMAFHDVSPVARNVVRCRAAKEMPHNTRMWWISRNKYHEVTPGMKGHQCCVTCLLGLGIGLGLGLCRGIWWYIGTCREIS